MAGTLEDALIDRNPYVIGVPLTGDAAFYGRQETFHSIKDVLEAQQQNVVVLYGQRRIGKTSVLHQGARWLQKQGAFFPVYFDLQGKERLTLREVLENLAQTIAKRVDIENADASGFDEDGRHFDERFLPRALERLGERRLVLLFDEFDVLGDELASRRAATETLFPYLQGLIVNQPRIGFVFVVGRRIEELATHFQAIFKQAVYKRVGHLKPDESRALIVEPARGVIAYDDDAVGAIQTLTAGHPYFTQLICFEAFNAVKANGDQTITADVVQEAVDRAIESGHGALNWFWEGLPRAERFILSAVAHASDKSGVGSKENVRQLLEKHHILLSGLELKDAPDRLVDWEMLRREGPDAYRFVVEIVRRWVVQEHPLSSARRDIDFVSKRAVRLFENAREAHSEGDLPYARDEYRRTLKANPNHSGAQLGLALVLFELGELEEALAEFEKAYAIDEMSARDGLIRVRLARADALKEQGGVDDAIVHYQKVLGLVPGEAAAARSLSAIYVARGEAALVRSDFDGARDAFREALKYDHGDDVTTRIQSSLTSLPISVKESGNVEHAADSYELLVELLPERDDVRTLAAGFWIRRGDELDAAGSPEDALTSYTKAVSLHPQDAAVVARLEAVTGKLKERQKIGQIFEQALAAHRAANFKDARDGWKKLIQLDVLSYQGRNIALLLSEAVTHAEWPASTNASDVKSETGEAAPSSQSSSTPHGEITTASRFGGVVLMALILAFFLSLGSCPWFKSGT
jgi:tetratricopeptide (TPR) repeat protein